MPVHTKKQRLGQYFLKNKNKLQEIVAALDLKPFNKTPDKPGETIIEIGPGHGELTKVLAFRLKVLGKNWKIIAIEKDRNFAQLLKNKFKNNKDVKIIEGDALKILPELVENCKLKIENYKIVGNIPYYITGHLLRIIGELKNKPSLAVLTIQKEVGERICDKPPKMNLLAASVQFWAEPEIVGSVPKTDFQPQPKVDSVIIKFEAITLSGQSSINGYKNDEERYYKLIRILFKQPRKTILNNLSKTDQPKNEIIKILEALKINPVDRPQNLTMEQIKKMTFQPSLSCLGPE